MRSHDLEDKVRLCAFVLKPLYFSRPFMFFHVSIIDRIIDYVNYTRGAIASCNMAWKKRI